MSLSPSNIPELKPVNLPRAKGCVSPETLETELRANGQEALLKRFPDGIGHLPEQIQAGIEKILEDPTADVDLSCKQSFDSTDEFAAASQ